MYFFGFLNNCSVLCAVLTSLEATLQLWIAWTADAYVFR